MLPYVSNPAQPRQLNPPATCAAVERTDGLWSRPDRTGGWVGGTDERDTTSARQVIALHSTAIRSWSHL